MKILHSSDLHGSYKRLIVEHATTGFDLWLDTGDLLPNFGRKRSGRIEAELEVSHQNKWLVYKNLIPRLAEWLRGRPAVLLPGNHDFLRLAPRLRAAGASAFEVGPDGIDVAGIRWAGFREVPFIKGEWPGEREDFASLIARTQLASPRVLVTHAPPSGMLDEEGGGVPGLIESLDSRPHGIHAHFFGHVHREGGNCRERGGVRFVNGATFARVHEISESDG